MNFWEKFKDFLYNSIDYIIMLIVIIAVVCIISWRLDILFVNNGANSTLTKNIENNNEDNKVVENIDGDQDNEATNEDNGEKVKEGADSESPAETAGDEKPTDEEAPVDTAGDAKDTEEKPEEKPAEKAEEKPVQTGTVEVNIPAKSLPGEIGKILEQQGVVSSATDFVNKCVELKLDTKLKSGKFTINKGASLDDVVKIIAQIKK